MPSLLPEGALPRVSRRRDPKSLPQLDHIVVLAPERLTRRLWAEAPGGERLSAAARRRGMPRAGGSLTLHLSDPCPVTVGFCDPSGPTFARASLCRKLAAEALAGRPARVGLMTLGAPDDQRSAWIEMLAGALLAAHAPMPRFKSSPSPRTHRLQGITVLDDVPDAQLERVRAEAEGNHLARWLAALPPNRLDAAGYRGVLEELATREGWDLTFLDEAALAEEGAGAFLAVARSNPRRDAGIARLRYRPGEADARPAMALVGKGIVFDTGGTNLKPFRSMLDMQEDMAGSAVALGTLVALSRLEFPEPVDCWLAITENRIGPDAYKSRDVVTAANGTTIEIIHTDAEGRMALADTLVLAGREKPGLIIDYATLTGACVHALTDRYSGAFTTSERLARVAMAAGRTSGERVWPFPMDEDFDEAIESSVADVLQCPIENEGDHIVAARFLRRFVPEDVRWLHLDLAGAHRKGGLGLAPTLQTGFGVRLTVSMLLDHQLLGASGGEDKDN
ncbi:MAG: leucyl aminopeptidase family protein [Gammaproteobacteria bacterium]